MLDFYMHSFCPHQLGNKNILFGGYVLSSLT